MLTVSKEDLENEIASAFRKIQSYASEGAVKGNLGRRNDAERRYHEAYQALVRAGFRQPLRGKYRG